MNFIRTLVVFVGVCLFSTAGIGCGDAVPVEEDLAAEFVDSYARAATGKFDRGSCQAIRLVDDVVGDYGNRVVLSFDDGPHPWRTAQVLDTLAAHGVLATFFIQGSNAYGATRQAILRRIVAEGHTVANHTENHEHLRPLSADRVRAEVQATNAVLAEAGVTPTYMRFPYGDASCEDLRTVENMGLRVAGWTVDTADWCYNSASPSYGGSGRCQWGTNVPARYVDDMVGYTLSQLARHGGGMVLMHDVHQYTVDQLDDMLTGIENAGYTFTTIDDASMFPLLNSGLSTSDSGLPSGMCEATGRGGARGFAAPAFRNEVISFAQGQRMALRGAQSDNGFWPVADRDGGESWVWRESVMCNASGGGGVTPPVSQQCTITSQWGARAFESANFNAADHGTLRQWAEYRMLDSELHNGAFYRIDPLVAGVSEAFVYSASVRCGI